LRSKLTTTLLLLAGLPVHLEVLVAVILAIALVDHDHDGVGEGVWLAAASGRLSQNTRSRCCNSIAEGFGSRHRDMPQIEFSSEQVDAILNYLGDLIV
jgi:hypothetical protein